MKNVTTLELRVCLFWIWSIRLLQGVNKTFCFWDRPAGFLDWTFQVLTLSFSYYWVGPYLFWVNPTVFLFSSSCFFEPDLFYFDSVLAIYFVTLFISWINPSGFSVSPSHFRISPSHFFHCALPVFSRYMLLFDYHVHCWQN